jgi:hypothetical protein
MVSPDQGKARPPTMDRAPATLVPRNRYAVFRHASHRQGGLNMGRATAASAATISLRDELKKGMRRIAHFPIGTRDVEIMVGRDSVWAMIRRAGRGGLALRLAHCWGGVLAGSRDNAASAGEALRLEVDQRDRRAGGGAAHAARSNCRCCGRRSC